MKPCDKNLAERSKPPETCGAPAVVTSSRGARHRCEAHHEGPGWRPIEPPRDAP